MNNIYLSENVQYMAEQNYNNLISCVANSNAIDLTPIITAIPLVRKAVFYKLASGEVLVGIMPEPLFSLTDRLQLMQNVEAAVKEITGQNVYVSLDTDVFVEISKCKDDVKAKSIKDCIIRRNSARM